MSSTRYRLVTAGSTNLTEVRPSPGVPLTGAILVNTAAYDIFLKLYWFDATAGAAAGPTVGTTIPDLTIRIPTAGERDLLITSGGIVGKGDLWLAVTKLAADSDTTAVIAGDGIIQLLFG